MRRQIELHLIDDSKLMIVIEFNWSKAYIDSFNNHFFFTRYFSELKEFVLHVYFSNIDLIDWFLPQDAIHRMPSYTSFFCDFIVVIQVDVEHLIVF